MSSFVFAGLAIISTSATGVLCTFGKFSRHMGPGLNLYLPFIQRVKVVSNRLSHQTFAFEVKTKDNVFAKMEIAVQHKIAPDNSSLSYFALDNPTEQIDAYIENVLRSSASRMTIDELFESQNSLCEDVSTNLSKKMSSFGYNIENVLVTNIEPDRLVKEAMNKINASKRLYESAKFDADAKYITLVREAEADRDRKRLQGEGISLQRRAIVDGFRDGVFDMAEKLNISHDKIVEFVLRTQQLDTMEHIGKSTNTKTVFMPYNDYTSDMFGQNGQHGQNGSNRVFESMSYSNEISPNNKISKEVDNNRLQEN